MMFLQADPAGTVEKLLSVNEVAVTGILLAIVAILMYFIVKLRQESAEKDKIIKETYEMLIKEQKDYTHNLLEVTNKVANTISQINEMIKLNRDK
jgi:adenosyl cobinamide kinase/adenosyl cobinamide phosphate guanylyltransferase